ncbi:hypothetical protein EI427_21610 [Flammeovirga pectinis]|uniref:Uncharacterized protein n=2 Tax=Flammeovirga pectinis TaxID=2494373 RepID=A0A3S9P9D4_9BACT|nr:hypothetical protein EI427_21610 [Flammeovirga pectinis]
MALYSCHVPNDYYIKLDKFRNNYNMVNIAIAGFAHSLTQSFGNTGDDHTILESSGGVIKNLHIKSFKKC